MPSIFKGKSRSNLRVLLVDDDANIIHLVRFVLREMGISRIETARDGDQALAVLTKGPDHFDLIICDWMMPTLSGLDVLKGIRSMNTRVPFLMLTAKASAEAIVSAKKAGLTSYIAKPFTPMDLRKKIEVLVDKARP